MRLKKSFTDLDRKLFGTKVVLHINKKCNPFFVVGRVRLLNCSREDIPGARMAEIEFPLVYHQGKLTLRPNSRIVMKDSYVHLNTTAKRELMINGVDISALFLEKCRQAGLTP